MTLHTIHISIDIAVLEISTQLHLRSATCPVSLHCPTHVQLLVASTIQTDLLQVYVDNQGENNNPTCENTACSCRRSLGRLISEHPVKYLVF